MATSLLDTLILLKWDYRTQANKAAPPLKSPRGDCCYIFMAYIPPHKRHSKDSNSPSPTLELLAPQFKRDLNWRSSRHNVDRVVKIINADQCLYRWLVVDLYDNHQFPSFLHLEPILEPIERTIGEKSLVLVNNHADKGGVMPCLELS
ncbi:hypothetical protein Pint_20249 [Pistacia integerrima]|uniref:Uncharacterized protein n=1 Tax=Pistacia integerrima TaxID=434235 RepID=A0ACC0XE45_9ROSI|nr:hypothetical protein Pint_20249 [Pistacia integerrima]